MPRIRKPFAPKSYAPYILKVHKQLHPKSLTLSTAALETVNAIVETLEERISAKAVKLALLAKKKTLKAQHIATATKIDLPSELSGHATAEAVKALARFTA